MGLPALMQLWCKLSAFSILGAAFVPLEKQTGAREEVNQRAIQYHRACIQFLYFSFNMETGTREAHLKCLKSHTIPLLSTLNGALRCVS
jgi:hypothetical protein